MARIIEDEAGIAAVVNASKRIAVLGIKTEAQAGQPAFDVPAYLQEQGLEVIPVPVYYPEVTTILGERVYRKVADIPGGPVDLLDVFRRPNDLPPHLDDVLAAKPKVVWLQLGIRNDGFAQKLVEAGIDVVQDRCLLVDHSRYAGRQG
ncbi:MAG: CoA-binding protein [Archangium sp.]|nr:CoA-binding protein [Archangium sp.]MBM4776489.1 CoA-binding protein [Archangiaceae bacterium]